VSFLRTYVKISKWPNEKKFTLNIIKMLMHKKLIKQVQKSNSILDSLTCPLKSYINIFLQISNMPW
jgi:hypothetical protein